MNETWWVHPEQLDEEQKKIVALPLDKSYLVLGPPGSGKTNLLLLRGSYAVRSNLKNILMLSFTRTLQEFIATGGTRYAFSTNKVMTCTRWQWELLWQYGCRPDPVVGQNSIPAADP